jgi:SET domain-containing protein
MKRYHGMKIQVRVGVSHIDGTGVFAAQPIKKGIRILEYIGEKISRQEATERLARGNVYVFFFDTRYDIDGNTPENIARYINHSCEPNCEAEIIGDSIWIIALRDIRAGEELSYDYGYELDDYEQRPCRCGAKNCCGYIVDKMYRAQIVTPQSKASSPKSSAKM